MPTSTLDRSESQFSSLEERDFSISLELTVREARELVELLPERHDLRIAVESHLAEVDNILVIQDVMKS